MSHDQIEQTNSTKPISIDSFDDFNFDELEFKPINKGLGFHHNEKRRSFQKPVAPTSRTHKGHKAMKATSAMPSQTVSNLGLSQELGGIANKSSLSAFYGGESTTKTIPPKALKLEAKAILKKEASFFMSFVAWLVDVILISTFSALTISLFIFVSGIEFQELLHLITFTEKISFIFLVFSTCHTLYFSILDLASSPGKALLGLTLVKDGNTPLRLKDTFVRSFASLISTLLLGIPCIFNLSGKISKTKVVQ